MSDQQQDTVITANDGPAADAVAAAVLATQLKIIDVAVRRARDQSWCEAFEAIMAELFPDGPPGGGTEFVDSDGWSCRGHDRDGYGRNGLDRDDRDRDGRDRNGYDRDGYDRDGYNNAGWNREGIHRDGRDRNSPEVQAEYCFDYYGFDRDGYNRNGRDPWNRTREQNATAGPSHNPYRFNAHGYDLDDRYNRTA